MPERRSEYQNPAQKEETIKEMKNQQRDTNLSKMPYVVLREIFKNVHPQSALKMMRANKSWNAFLTRNRRFWRKISMEVRIVFDRLSDDRVAFIIVLTPVGANRKFIIKMEEAESGTPITPDEDIFIQQELNANVADAMGQLLKLMKTVAEMVNITMLDLRKMPDEATIALAAIFDMKTIESFYKIDNSLCPRTLQQFVGSLSDTKCFTFCVPSEAITADLFKLPQIQNAHRLDIILWIDYLPLGDADLLALKTRILRFSCRSDITQRCFRTIVEEFMSFKRNFDRYEIYYEGILAPKQVFDGFAYSVLERNRRKKNFTYAVKRSDDRKLVVESRGYHHYIRPT